MITKIQIKSWLGDILFEHEEENNTIKKTVVKAAASGANLYGADLSGYISIGPIGSRASYLWARWEDKEYVVNSGCFSGTLKEFEESVKSTHKEGVHREEYLAAIKLLELRMKYSKPKLEEKP